MTEILPEVLLNALRQYNFDGSPLWRMADGKDHVQIQVTFRKSTEQQDKKRAVSRKKSTPSAGEWPRQPRPARRPTEILRQTPPPTEEIIPAAPPATIERPPPAVTATYDESPIIAEPVEDEEEEEAMETRTNYIKECPESLPKHYVSKIVHDRFDDGSDLIIYQLRHKVQTEKHRKPAYATIYSRLPDSVTVQVAKLKIPPRGQIGSAG